MADEVKSLVRIQEDSYERLRKAQANYKKSPRERLTASYIATKSEALEKLWELFLEGHNAIVGAVDRSEKAKLPYFVEDVFTQCEEIYSDYKTKLREDLRVREPVHQIPSKDSVGAAIDYAGAGCDVKLPRIELPKFSGSYDQWQNFHDMFDSLINKNSSLSAVHKLHYLKSCLSGEPENLLKNLSTTELNYTEAWSQLIRRYNNKRYNANEILKRLFSQKNVTHESSNAIKQLLDTSSSCLKSLNNIQIDTRSWDAIIVYLITSKLDPESRKLWEVDVGRSDTSEMADTLPTWVQLKQFLERRFRTLEMLEPINKSAKPVQLLSANNSRPVKTFHSSVQQQALEKRTTSCPCCNGTHHICHCKVFSNKSVQERYEIAQEKRLCYNCLGSTHSIKMCRQPTNCRKCGKRHHSLLHNVKDKSLTTSITTNNFETREQQVDEPNKTCSDSDTRIIANFSMKKQPENQSYNVLLATAVVKANSNTGSKIMIRALLDQGSQASFVTESTVQLLGLKRTPINGWVSGVGEGQTKIKHKVTFCVESSYNPNNKLIVDAFVLNTLTSLLPSKTTSLPIWQELEELPLADPTFNSPGKIDILLGAEVYSDILLSGITKHPQGHLLAQNTTFGWIISGRVSPQSESGSIITMHVQAPIDGLLKQFWEIEREPPSIQKKMTHEEQLCEKLYDTTTKRAPDGRYVVKLPFKNDDPECQYGNHRAIANKRLNYLESKLTKKPQLYEEYRAVLEDYKILNHMKPINLKDIDNPKAVYLPHHAVVREDKSTTKLRVVFDGSCKGTNSVALNDDLLVGPKLQQDLRHLIMRWRNHKICIIADLVKMYRQVRVADEDLHYQRILWRSDANQEVQHYNLLTLTFGTACAPYLAVKTIQRLADDEESTYPVAAQITKKDYYIDDLMTGCDTESEALRIYEEMSNLMNAGGFELQKWSSNNETLLNHIGQDKQRTNKSVTIKSDNVLKVLGICWSREADQFEYSINLPDEDRKPTKRKVLSHIARLFDPLGWIAPVMIVAKIFMQKLWKSGLDWDEELTEELSCEWVKYRNDLNQVKKICIPRWLHYSPGYDVELHVFSDASQAAYAAALYVRTVDPDNQVTVSLLTAKTKVAPVEKEMSIPRLELSGAALAAKMLAEASEVMGVPRNKAFGWTDSTVVLAWLKGPACRWTTFVSNRVSEILTIIDYDQWGHVSTQCNPADCASRGLKPGDLAEHELWWQGPSWLKEVPVTKDKIEINDTHEEEKINTLHTYQKIPEEKMPWQRFSSLSRMLRVLSYCRRTLNLKKPKSERKNISKLITREEFAETLKICIKQVQEQEFEQEIREVKKKGFVGKRSYLRALCPMIDESGIFRVGGRIQKADVAYDKRHPIILPSQNHLSELIIADAHLKTMHGGPQLMLNFLRSQYWIIRARDMVKKYYRNCTTCLRYSEQNNTQLMGRLPESRLKPMRAFKTAGVDFTGHINIRFSPGRGAKSYKGYICLFVCMFSKAIHLEAVSDLTSKGFIAAFRRFVSRRGHCQTLFSDNGTNFVGADKELQDMYNRSISQLPDELRHLLANEGTTWKFIPPQAPNFGGLWEAGVRSAKKHLKRVIGDSTLTFEELYTVLTQIEACLNSRPLSYLSDNPDDPMPLTPGHFLVGEPLRVIPDEANEDGNMSDLKRWRYCQKLTSEFWRKWSDEYLVTLHQRYKWASKKSEPDVDDVVIVKDKNIPPAKWWLGKIVKKHTGTDNVTRVVSILTKNGIIKRPCSKLCFLPRSE